MKGKVVIVTGANSGIGKATATALAGMGATVVLTARDMARGDRAVEDVRRQAAAEVHLMRLNLASLASVRAFAAGFLAGFDRLDVLVNNAGVYLSDRRVTEDGFEMTFGVNHLGPFLLTALLLDRLKASAPSRIVNVSSTGHRGAKGGLVWDDLGAERGYIGLRAYARSKLANILFTRELARRLEGTGVTANALHPGAVSTGFGGDGDSRLMSLAIKIGRPFLLSPEQGARTSVYLASSPEVEGVTGEYFARSKPARPTLAARDDDAARRLWETSERLVGLSA